MFPILKCLVLLQDLSLWYVMLPPRKPSLAISENLYSPTHISSLKSGLFYFILNLVSQHLFQRLGHHKFLVNILLNVLMNLLLNKKMEYLHFLPV